MSAFKAYLPLHALRSADLQSILSIAVQLSLNEEVKRKVDYHQSRRTMLYYLLSTPEEDRGKLTELAKTCRLKLDWTRLENDYNLLKQAIEPYQMQNRAEKLGPYWELKKSENVRQGPKQAREYISKYRKDGFRPEELKIYWNYGELLALTEENRFNPETDTDATQALKAHPVHQRRNAGKIQFVRSGIEQAVFQVPENKQVIVLDFADERMPGGYFLENARTQEEVILYNSDGYRALLDLKYTRMDGGYMLPEYGLAYIKRVRFFQEQFRQERLTDLIVAACYDLSGMGEGLYRPPSQTMKEKIRKNTYEKFQAIIASAVANTEGDGSNTYLLLGPIGTGAFANDPHIIAEIFAEVLHENLMHSSEAIRFAFEEIWFVSTDSLDAFASTFAQSK